MPSFRELIHRASDRLHRRALTAELEAELRFHRGMLERDRRLEGLADPEASHAALRQLGNVTTIGEETRDMWSFRWIEDLTQDVRYAIRGVARAPVFALTAVLALGVGTGSASAVFSLLDGVVLRPLPYARPDRLVSIWETDRVKGLQREQLSPVNFMDYRALNRVFDDAAAWWVPQVSLTDQSPAEPLRVSAVETSQNLFGVLGVRPAIGHDFSDGAQLYGASREAIISARLLQSRFGGNPAVVGQTVTLNGTVYTIIGVMPPGFSFPAGTDLWEGLGWNLLQHVRGAHFMEAVARMRPGVTPAMADAALAARTAQLGRQYPTTNGARGAHVIPLGLEVAGVFRPALYALFGASGLLLLVACINVANLLLARAAARGREVAVRTVLGAGRARLVRLFFTESLVLALLGSAVGIAFAVVAVTGLLRWAPIDIPRAADVSVNLTVLAFSTVVATLTALAFGIAPAVVLSRGALHESIKDGARGSSARRGRGALVVAEVTLAVMLLAGAGLLIRSISHLLGEHTGVDPVSVITADVQLPATQYPKWSQVDQFYSALLDALRARPEVVAAGASNFLPLQAGWRMPLIAMDTPRPAAGEEPQVQHESVDDGYFQALRVPLLAGRYFAATDNDSSAGVVIVNETLARRFWPNESAIGKYVLTSVRQIGPLGRRTVPDSVLEVVGVVADVKNTSLESGAEPEVFYPARQFTFLRMNVVLRARGNPAAAGAILRDEIRRLGAVLPAPQTKTMDRVLSESTDPPRFVMFLMTSFAVLALGLAAVGIYGILNYAVSQRRREFAIRLALGAQPGRVLRQVVGEGLRPALLGCVIGAAGAAATGHVLGSFLYEVKPWDAATLSVVLGVVLVVSLAACLAPAWRAAGEDPAAPLRAE